MSFRHATIPPWAEAATQSGTASQKCNGFCRRCEKEIKRVVFNWAGRVLPRDKGPLKRAGEAAAGKAGHI